jgi:hypothetical protein
LEAAPPVVKIQGGSFVYCILVLLYDDFQLDFLGSFSHYTQYNEDHNPNQESVPPPGGASSKSAGYVKTNLSNREQFYDRFHAFPAGLHISVGQI